jgi:manganese/iron transport system substrate-binding protein
MNISSSQEFRQRWGIRMLAIGLTSLLLACNQTQVSEEQPTPKPKRTSEKLQVIATTTVLCDLTKIIAGSTIDLKCLMSPEQEPQAYVAKVEELNTADILLYNGYGLENGMMKILKDSTVEKKVPVAEIAITNPEKKDGKPNPYLWHNAFRALEMAKTIRRTLTDALPKNEALYEKNYDNFDAKMTVMQEWLKQRIASIDPKKRQLVTSRFSLIYYSNPYNIAVEGSAFGISTADKLTAAQTTATVDRIKKLKIATVFNEVHVDPQPLADIAAKAGIKVAKGELYTDGLGKSGSGAETYVQMMEHNTKVILEGLGGKYIALQLPKDKKEEKKAKEEK